MVTGAQLPDSPRRRNRNWIRRSHMTPWKYILTRKKPKLLFTILGEWCAVLLVIAVFGSTEERVAAALLAGATFVFPGSLIGLAIYKGMEEDVRFLERWQLHDFGLEELPRTEADRILLRPRVELVLARLAIRAIAAFHVRNASHGLVQQMRKSCSWLQSECDLGSTALREKHPEEIRELEKLLRQSEICAARAEREWRSFLFAWDFFDTQQHKHHFVLEASLSLLPHRNGGVWKKPEAFMRSLRLQDPAAWPQEARTEAFRPEPSVAAMGDTLFTHYLSRWKAA